MKVSLTVQVEKKLREEAQRLIDAGEFRHMSELVSEALHELLERYAELERAQQFAARMFQGLREAWNAGQRKHFDEFVVAYTSLAPNGPQDDELMLQLAEIFDAGHGNIGWLLAALHEGKDSQIPLTPNYLESLVVKALPPKPKEIAPVEIKTVVSEVTLPTRVPIGTDNPVLAEVSKLYEQEIGGLTEKVGEQLKSLVADYPDIGLWHEAFDAAATMNKRNLRYVVACLKNVGKPKPETHAAQRGKSNRGISQSERHRSDKRKQIKDYEDYWDQKLKERQKARTERAS
jgi:Arc/MetJ-type ribon-helix-helix transcriptional regulator